MQREEPLSENKQLEKLNLDPILSLEGKPPQPKLYMLI